MRFTSAAEFDEGIIGFGTLCILFGFLLLLTRRTRRPQLLVRLALFSLPFATLALAVALTSGVSVGLLTSHALYLLVLLLGLLSNTRSFRDSRRRLAKAACHPLFHAFVLISFGFASMLGWASYHESAIPEWNDSPERESLVASPHMEIPRVTACTDRGSAVLLLQPRDRDEYAVSVETENEYQSEAPLGMRLLRVGAPDTASNCFGWVFTAGRYWVRSRDVPLILRDNGYEKTTTPEPDDLILYSQGDGPLIQHVGIVRMIDEEGQILIESKWGKNGRFLHAPSDQIYSYNYTYYRTRRGGHMLFLSGRER